MKMDQRRICDGCNRIFAQRHSLWKHKKRYCKGTIQKPKDFLHSLKQLNSDDEAYIVKELQQLVQTVVDEFQNNKSIVPILKKYWTQSNL